MEKEEKSELYRPDGGNFTLYLENVISDLHSRRTISDTSDVFGDEDSFLEQCCERAHCYPPVPHTFTSHLLLARP
jgi:hypothetical protein